MKGREGLVIFGIGAVVGASVMYFALNEKYKVNFEEENEFQKKRAKAKKKREKAKKEEEAVEEKPKNDISVSESTNGKYADLEKYVEKIRAERYSEKQIVSASENKPEAYVIPPEEFGEFDGYERISLTLYEDGYLCEGLNPVENIRKIVGDGLEHIGEFEEDAIHVRNDPMKCDFEVLCDHRKFIDVVNERMDSKPRRKRNVEE